MREAPNVLYLSPRERESDFILHPAERSELLELRHGKREERAHHQGLASTTKQQQQRRTTTLQDSESAAIGSGSSSSSLGLVCMNRNLKQPQMVISSSTTEETFAQAHKARGAQRSTINRSSSSSSSSCNIFKIILLSCSIIILLCSLPRLLQLASGASSSGERMVRLCIASVDPIKLSSQCVMCNRREFPLTVIDCTGITKVNDLIANPLSVREATCLIYNCRRQVPDIKPELYHGSVSNAVNYRGGMTGGAAAAMAASNYQQLPGTLPPLSAHTSGPLGQASGSSLYEMMTPSGMLGGGYSMLPPSLLSHPDQQRQQLLAAASPYMTRLGLGYGGAGAYQAAPTASSILSPLASFAPRGIIGGPSLLPNRQQQALPYALVPAPFGSRKYKAALVPLFK